MDRRGIGMTRFSIKPEVYFQAGALEYLTTLQAERALLVTDPFMVKAGYADKIQKILNCSVGECAVFSEVRPDPPIEIVAQGAAMVAALKPDLVIALGGGSSIDAAKSILFFAERIAGGEDSLRRKPLFIAIPTTSGTGSEVTSFSVMTVGSKKVPLVHQDLLPDVALLDAEFVRSAPPSITADTAIDALTHAIEAYASTDASDFSDALAEKAIRMIFDHLLTAYRNGADMAARTALHHASCLAGMAFTNASLGINHSMAHALGGAFHIPHGRANAVLLPYVIAYNAGLGEAGTDCPAAGRYAQLAELLRLPAASKEEGVASLIGAAKALLRLTDTPLSLADLGIGLESFEARLEEMCKAALEDACTRTNPRTPDLVQLAELFRKAYGQ